MVLNHIINWFPGWDLNLQPFGYQPNALPIELPGNGASSPIRTDVDFTSPGYKSGAIDHYAILAFQLNNKYYIISIVDCQEKNN